MRIVLCYPAQAQHLDQIRAVAPDWELVDAGQERIAEQILTADIYCGHAKVPVPWAQVVRQGRLQWIQSSAAGLDHCLVPEVIASDIPVTSASGVLADQVTEHCLALLGGLLRSLPVFFRAQEKREFVRRPTRDLHHATIGIVGLGGVGRRLAEVLQAFKTRILATDWCPYDKPDYVEALWPPERLLDLCGQVDILILCAPLNDHTRGMIDRRVFAALRPGSLFVNVARGALVVEDDLIAALSSGHLAGAAVDVTATEPLPAGSRLWGQENVIITPHVGGQAARRLDDCTNFFCENLRRFRLGEPLRNLVDKQLGFPLRRPSNPT